MAQITEFLFRVSELNYNILFLVSTLTEHQMFPRVLTGHVTQLQLIFGAPFWGW